MKRILIVDDLEPNRYLLEVTLQSYGYEVISAHDGAEALSADRFVLKWEEPQVMNEIVRDVLAHGAKTAVSVAAKALPDEMVTLREYNEALVPKLEKKLNELETTHQQLLEDMRQRQETEAELLRSRGQVEAIVHSVDGIVWELEIPTFQFTFVSQQADRSRPRHCPRRAGSFGLGRLFSPIAFGRPPLCRRTPRRFRVHGRYLAPAVQFFHPASPDRFINWTLNSASCAS